MNASALFCRFSTGFLFVVSLFACSAFISKPEPPRVTLVGLRLISVELLEQRYQVSLRVKNPNAIVLPLRGMDFRLDINGETFADGVTSQSVDVPAYGEEVIELEVSSNVLQVFRQFQLLQKEHASRFGYRISGSLATAVHGKLPFDYSGELRLSAPGQADRQQGV